MSTYSTLIRSWPFIGSAAAAACLALAGPAQAAEKMWTVATQVSTAGLALDTPQGAAILYSRLQTAARVVCSDGMRVGLAPAAPHYRECFEGTLASAVRSAALPQLTAAYLRSHSPAAAEAHGFNVPVLAASK